MRKKPAPDPAAGFVVEGDVGRLRQAPPRLAALPARLRRRPDEGPVEHRNNPLRHLYKTRRWRRLRWAILLRDLFTCQCGCGVGPVADTSTLVADHKRQPFGDEALFWDPANLQTLRVAPCHNRLKQQQEAAARHHAGHWD